MFSSLRFRLWLTYALVVGVVICIAGTAAIIYLLRNPATDRSELQRLRVISAFLVQRSQMFTLEPAGLERPRLEQAVQRADSFSGARIAVYSDQGELLADSRSETQAALPELAFFKTQRLVERPIFRDASQRQWLYVLTPLERGYHLLLAAPRLRLPILAILRDDFLTPFTRGFVLAMVLSLLMAFWIANWITAPLLRMGEAARAVSAGEFRKLPLKGPKEVQEVARAFNEMGEKVQATQRSQRDFIANVSHDLKTPLTSIQGFAQAILDGTAEELSARKQAAEVIYSEAERMHRMVLDLLELARLDSGVVSFERRPLDLDKLLDGVVEQFTPQAGRAQVELSFAHPPAEPDVVKTTIIGDADRLSQVFTNLVDNAIKNTPPGGQVQVSARSFDGWVEVKVADTGQGIPVGELERIFERFYQTDKARRGGSWRGVGLGLAIAREIVQAHGGSISAQRVSTAAAGNVGEGVAPASGSVFVVRLPVTRPDDITLARRR